MGYSSDVVTTKTNGARTMPQRAPRRADVPASPRVTVVITCYNQAQYLDAAIESVLEQAYAPVEVILVDDGSTDHTEAVAAQYPSVRYVRQRNQGLAAARNTGLHESTGECLVFLDADDWLLEGALETGMQVLEDHPECAFVAGGHLLVEETGRACEKEMIPDVDGALYPELLRGNVIGMHAAVMYRRNALVADGGFDPSLPAAEDYDLYLRLARRYSAHVHTTPVAAYRKHANNMSNDPTLMRKAVLGVLRRQEKFIRRDERLARAYRSGIAHWTAYYGQQQLVAVKAEWQRGGMARWGALRTLAALWWKSPAWTTRRAVRAVAQRMLYLFMLMLPVGLRRKITRWSGRTFDPPVLYTRFGDLRRTTPISRAYGYDRGQPVDRYYIEQYLQRRADDIQGCVLEIGDNAYTRRFGGERVTQSDVLHVYEGNPAATFVGDLTAADHLPSRAFDCIILTQTLQLIYDVREAIATLHRILKPGGVLLATFPGISSVSDDVVGEGWYWAFTRHSAQRLFEEAFPQSKVQVEGFGNVLAATAFLQGLAAEELTNAELDARDPDYDTLLTVRAEKPAHDYTEPMTGRWDYEGAGPAPYDDETSYRKGLAFLDGHGVIEDWGCGTAYARRFVEKSDYVGLDGSKSDFVDRVVDLQDYRSSTDCIFMRHVLEHNYGWQQVLANAVASFEKRMTLVIFTPFVEETRQINTTGGIPDLAFNRGELTAFFEHLSYREEVVVTDTQYRVEHIFYIEKHDAARASTQRASTNGKSNHNGQVKSS